MHKTLGISYHEKIRAGKKNFVRGQKRSNRSRQGVQKKRKKNYIRLTLLISILFGIILPLALGIKDLTYIAILFTLVWILYIIIRWIAFLIRPELKIKVLQYKNPTIVRFELSDASKMGADLTP